MENVMHYTHKAGVSEIAKLANVSIGTVSNYLNYPERVSPSLREKVQQAITELGYTPHRRNYSLLNTDLGDYERKNNLLAYVFADIEHSLYVGIFEGIQEVSEENDMQVIAVNSFSDKAKQQELVHMLVSLGVSGILLSTVQDPVDEVAFARSKNIPIVIIDRSESISTEPICCVLEDNIACGRMAIEELISIGCKHLMLVGHSFDYESVRDRVIGMKQAVAQAGDDISLKITDAGGLIYDDGYQFGKSICDLDAGDRPDGIVAITDHLAIGAINGIVENSDIKIPDEISIIGCEGCRLETASRIPLTVVCAPSSDIGTKAVEQLLDESENPKSHIHCTTAIKPTLIRRESTNRHHR